MKDFLRYTLATVTGLFLFGFVMLIFTILSVIGMAVSAPKDEPIKDNSVLVMKLNGEITDHTASDDDIMAQLMGEVSAAQGLDYMTDAIQKAKADDRIKGIYIEAGSVEADPATLQSLRDVLEDFKQSKKFIVAYADQYSQGSYYVASVADKIWMNPLGILSWHGMGAQPRYVRDFLDKVGIKMQVVKVGQYKSATETYTEDHMSDANREQVTAYITGIWQHYLKDISESRKISVDSLNSYADQVLDFASAKDLIKKKIIDAALYTDQAKAEVKKMLALDWDEAVPQVSLAQMRNSAKLSGDDDNQIAVYYCEGSIVQQEMQGALMGDAGIVGPKVCKDLEKLAKDDDVKAVVVRINSGGGDAYASEQMWHQIMELKKKKPVVVSMGGMAASGGYYMACGANWIVAEPTTLTGSIGIFGTFPDASKLMTEKLGLKYDEVKTNKHSTMSVFATSRPFSQEEIDLLQEYINRGYSLFRQRVADGRKMKVDEVEKIAQGHVWLGKDALGIHLVDQLGSLDNAITKAKQLAKLDDYSVKAYPKKADWMESLLNQTKGTNSYLDEKMREVLGEYYEPFVIMKTIRQQSPVQARMEFSFKVR